MMPIKEKEFPVTEFCKVSSTGQITIPAKVREDNNIEEGQLLEIRFVRIIQPQEEKEE